LTITSSQAGAAFASITPAVVDRSNGWYSIALTTGHTNTLGDLGVHVTGSGADPLDFICRVVAIDLTSATNLGLSNLDVVVSSRMATFSYTASPTVAAIRAEMDSNSTKLANLDAAVSTRMATFSYTTPPTVAAIRTEIDTNSTKLDVVVSSRLASVSYVVAPTVAAIRTEIDTNSTKLDVAVSTRMATFSYTTPPTVGAIGAALFVDGIANKLKVNSDNTTSATATVDTAAIAAALFVDGNTNKLKVNTDHSVNTAGGSGAVFYYNVPTNTVNGYKKPSIIPALTYCTLQVQLPLLGMITGYDRIWFTVKRLPQDSDSAALLMIEQTAGLLYVNGTVASDVTKGSITVVSDTVGLVTIKVDQTMMGLLPIYTDTSNAPIWDCKIRNNGAVTELVRGVMTISGAVTQAIA
jgi:hypothetical protein